MPDFKDYLTKNLSINENTKIVEALKTLSSWISNGVDGVKKIPFQEELSKVILNIAELLEEAPIRFLFDGIPFLTILTSLTTSLIMLITTLVFGLIWIEALKKIKIKEYKGQDVSVEKVKEIINDQVDNIKQISKSFNPAT